MQALRVLAISAVLVVGAHGRAEAGKTCISSATEALRRINGLVVKRSRTRAAPPVILASWKGQAKPMMLDVDVETEGDMQTYSYLCVITGGSAFVQRTMN
ncbi:MAG TPA: hypothetical protein VKT76_02790 [Bradyrhizobium sp.]|nr:hypothetical protein [Bradyrhizobium sp.]